MNSTAFHVKRLALQKSIDQESVHKQATSAFLSHSRATVEAPEEKMKLITDDSKYGTTKKLKKAKKKDRTFPDGTLAGGENGMAVPNNEVMVKEEETLNGGGEKKKKKKRKADAISLDENTNDGDGKESKKKSKKNQLAESQVQTELPSIKEEKQPKKEKKAKKKAKQIKEQIMIEEIETESKKVPKKSKKEKNEIKEEENTSCEHIKDRKKKNKLEEDGITLTKKEKKAKLQENEVILETAEGASDEVGEVKRKKKKKNKAEANSDVALVKGTDEAEPVETKKKKKKNKTAPSVSEPAVEEESEEQKGMANKKTDKSKKCQDVAGEEEGTGLTDKKQKIKRKKAPGASVEENDEVKSKKKRKKNGKDGGELLKTEGEAAIEEEEEGESAENVTVPMCDPIKKKKVKKDKVQATDETPRKKKRKIKEEDSPHLDMVLSEKSGNKDEERRQASKMDIDEASQPPKAEKALGLGQWSTAQFESSEQQSKFLRLMGGFKKGFQPAAATNGGTGGNMALGKDAQQHLQQGLLGEFERAHTRRMDFNNRGAGLGFSAPSNKKFAIDINACRSVRFDD